MKVLMNAGPWLPVPPHGYGGIENVVATLVPELRRLGVHVVLATVGDSELEVDERVSVFPTGQFAALQRPYNQVCGIVPAHLHGVVRELRRRRGRAFAERNAEFIRDLQARGLADPELDPALAASALSAMVGRIAYSAYIGGEAWDLEDLVATLTRLWANALQVQQRVDFSRRVV